MTTPIGYPESIAGMYAHLKQRLDAVVPEFELKYKAELAIDINRVKKEKRAIILGHNYMEPALFHSVPDFTGDSLELAGVAAQADADIVVVCGVRFMAETAKILNPGRVVLLPSEKAGCSLAASMSAPQLRALKARFPGAPVVTYINTTAEIKAEAGICCTSSNASRVVQHLREQGYRRIIFVPDQFLAGNTARDTGADLVLVNEDSREDLMLNDAETTLIAWRGACEVHERFTVEDVENIRKQFPDTKVLTHPESKPEVVAAADFSGGTAAMIQYVKHMPAGRYVLLTECAMGDNISASFPDKEMLRLCSIRCPHMNEITLERTLDALMKNQFVVDLPEDVRTRAFTSMERMLAL